MVFPTFLYADSPTDSLDYDLQYALDFVRDHNTEFLPEFVESGLPPEFLWSIVFPELVRYSIIRDRIEIAGLIVFYVHVGGRFADFSIGPFQMKPSFVERLERTVIDMAGDWPAADGFRNILMDTQLQDEGDEKGMRAERVRRLRDPIWQARYLSAVASYLNFRFPGDAGSRERSILFATAYNVGFWKPREEIESWYQRDVFPFGLGDRRSRSSYGEIVNLFWDRFQEQRR